MTAGDFKPVGYITKTIQGNTSGYTEGYVCGVPFRGNFNGCGHTISVNISGSYADGGGYKVSYLGLFGYIDRSVIENVTVTGYVSGSSNTAGIVGVANHSSIKNCINMASISASSGGCAGIASIIRRNCVVEKCYNGAYISGQSRVAGIVQIAVSQFKTSFD